MKKFMKFAVMAAFALVTVYNVHKVQTEVVLSDTQLKNVEALANNEWLEGSTSCFKNVTWGTVDGLAVWVTWCEYHCMTGWATHASNPSTCSPV